MLQLLTYSLLWEEGEHTFFGELRVSLKKEAGLREPLIKVKEHKGCKCRIKVMDVSLSEMKRQNVAQSERAV